MEDVIKLNVGGVFYTTTKSTLCRYPDSMLGAMFNGRLSTTKDENNNYFIDRDGRIFQHILNFLRSSHLSLPNNFTEFELLRLEADFYQIQPLIEAITQCQNPSLEQKQCRFIEVIEVRTGSTATMPTNNSRIKTIVSGRKDVILSIKNLPESTREKLHETEYPEVELHGSNIRLKLGEELKSNGWALVDSTMSTSSAYDSKSVVSSLIIEHSFRDRWYWSHG